MLTTYSISKGNDFIVVCIKPIQETSSISSSLRLSKNDIDLIINTVGMTSANEISNHFIYTLARTYMQKITAHIAESTRYIDDENLNQLLIDYCKKMDHDEIQIMSKETYMQFVEELTEIIKETFNVD